MSVLQESLGLWLVFGACLALSFVLSGMEAGVFALNRLRIRQRMRAGQTSARVLHGYLEHSEDFLWTILVGNTLANFVILGWLLLTLRGWIKSTPGLVAAYAVAVFLVFALFDLLPKMLFRIFPNRLCLFFAPPFRFIHLLLRPLVALMQWCSGMLLRRRGGKVYTGRLFGNRQELRLVMQESSHALTSDERIMVNRVLDLQTLTVRQVMAPLSQAVTVTDQTPVSQLLAICRERNLTRLPVWESAAAAPRIRGLVNLNNLLFRSDLDASKPVGDYLKPALYLEEDLRLEDALNRMQRSGHRLAVVLSQDRREIGIISLQDVLKVIFGEVNL